MSNCGRDFQLELTKPSFHSDARAILTGVSIDLTQCRPLPCTVKAEQGTLRMYSCLSNMCRYSSVG